jgi:hypothetical protein
VSGKVLAHKFCVSHVYAHRMTSRMVESSQMPCLVMLRRELTNVMTIYRSINKREERTQMASDRDGVWKFSK